MMKIIYGSNNSKQINLYKSFSKCGCGRGALRVPALPQNPETVIHGPVGMFGRLEQGDLGDRGDQGAPVLESSGFQKYSIC